LDSETSHAISQFLLIPSSTVCIIFLTRELEWRFSFLLSLVSSPQDPLVSSSAKAPRQRHRTWRIIYVGSFSAHRQVTVDEALGRHITNQAMLQQLDLLRDAMHRGYYVLDTFRYQCHNEKTAKYQGSCSLTRNTHVLEPLHNAFDDLNSMIRDVQELVMFLRSYPRLYRQPYSMHLLLDTSMFGRQMEAELAIKFLLRTQPHGSEELDVLPIVGPGRVGKSTLVAHVCKDERVYDHFSHILLLHDHDFIDDKLATFREECAMKHQNHVLDSNRDGRFLVVVELERDLNGDAWNRLYSASKQHTGISSRHVHSEALIPRCFVHLAMEIAWVLNGSFIDANVTALLLRDNFDVKLWCKGSSQEQLSQSGEHPVHLLNQNRPARIGRMAKPAEDLVVYRQYQLPSLEEVPKIGLREVVYESMKHHGKLEVLGWTSPIPPYYSYIFTCEIQELKTTATKRKRSMQDGNLFFGLIMAWRNGMVGNLEIDVKAHFVCRTILSSLVATEKGQLVVSLLKAEHWGSCRPPEGDAGGTLAATPAATPNARPSSPPPERAAAGECGRKDGGGWASPSSSFP
ncbi:hypothetical protein EJB05_40798, partial [Eragrostis curvula]